MVIGCHLLPDGISTGSNTLRLMERRVKLLEVRGACAIPWCCQPFSLVNSKYRGLVPYLWTTIFSYILVDSPNFLLFPTYRVISVFSTKSLSLMAGIDLWYLCISCHKETKTAFILCASKLYIMLSRFDLLYADILGFVPISFCILTLCVCLKDTQHFHIHSKWYKFCL